MALDTALAEQVTMRLGIPRRASTALSTEQINAVDQAIKNYNDPSSPKVIVFVAEGKAYQLNVNKEHQFVLKSQVEVLVCCCIPRTKYVQDSEARMLLSQYFEYKKTTQKEEQSYRMRKYLEETKPKPKQTAAPIVYSDASKHPLNSHVIQHAHTYRISHF